jgi:hypothetical protein
VHHDADEEEDSNGDNQESEIEIATVTLAIVQLVNDNPIDKEAYGEPKQYIAKAWFKEIDDVHNRN